MSLYRKTTDQSPMILGALILLMDLWIVYGALMSTRSIAFKLGWTLTVFMFPFGGLLLYLPVSFLLS
ncbi:uncharacterized protein EV154DRAFT_529521 [Mucor mucedo]|uniref:uncharacterized protein n=1 Tax=Mucor mucedo TaxID=29922 RepID=UPI00222109E1|nr:uncharacterized protein EV154DRAFT_529521 [Mucor mucedo]KAI7871963.1 hypothetical protein EV154DRAFT_529521 [Mucor mucedo]